MAGSKLSGTPIIRANGDIKAVGSVKVRPTARSLASDLLRNNSKRRNSRESTLAADALLANFSTPIKPPQRNKATLEHYSSGVLDSGVVNPAIEKLITLGYAVNLSNGEALVTQTDFELPGPMVLQWCRTYRSSNSDNQGIGVGWSAPWLSRLAVQANKVIYYDGEGREISFKRPNKGDGCVNKPERLTLYCDENERFAVVTAAGDQYLFQGDGADKWIHHIVSAAGHAIQFYYNDNGRLAYVIDSVRRCLKLEYNLGGRVRAVQLYNDKGKPQGKPLVQYRYDKLDNLIAVVDAAGYVQRYNYKNHIITQRIDKDGCEYFFQWDSYCHQGKCVRHRGDANVPDYRIKYNEQDRITVCTDSSGNDCEYYFNEFGLIEKKIDAEGGVWQWQYDKSGRLTREQNPLAHATIYNYNRQGLLSSITNAAGFATQFLYDQQGRLIGSVDAMGQRWQRRYDNKGRLSEVVDPENLATAYRYDPQGNPIMIVDTLKRSLRMEWNQRSELVATTDAAGQRTFYEYDEYGRVITITDHSGKILRYSYDPAGRVTQVVYADGSTMSLEYSGEGRLLSCRDSTGAQCHYRYNANGLPIEYADGNGTHMVCEYNAEGNMLSLAKNDHACIELQYDKNQRLVKKIDFDGSVYRYSYNAAGQLTCFTDAAQQVTQFKRDPLGRLLQIWSSDHDNSRYEYDALGRMVRAANTHADVKFVYNANGYLLEENQDGKRLRHHYDDAGQRVQSVLPSGGCIDYDYNAQGLLKRVAFNGHTITSITRNNLGQEIVRTSGDISCFFQYDAIGRLVHQRAHGGDAIVFEQHYQQAARLRLSQIDVHAIRSALAFLSDANLKEMAVNPLAGFGRFSVGNSLLAATDSVFSQKGCDEIVRLVRGDERYFSESESVDGTKGSANAKESELFNPRRSFYVKVDGDGNEVQYFYDALGRRVKKKAPYVETSYLWDGERMLLETDKKSKTVYVHEPMSTKLLCQVCDNKVFYYHNDQFGNPIVVTDMDANVVWQAEALKASTAAEFGRTEIKATPLADVESLATDKISWQFNLSGLNGLGIKPEPGAAPSLSMLGSFVPS